jgi:hypothetical protein
MVSLFLGPRTPANQNGRCYQEGGPDRDNARNLSAVSLSEPLQEAGRIQSVAVRTRLGGNTGSCS